MAKRTIVLVVSGPEGYGVRSVWVHLVRILSQSGFDIVIAVFDRQFVENWQREFPDIEIISPPFDWQALPTRIGQGGRYRQILRRGLSQLKLAGWLAGVVRRRSARAIVLQKPLETLLGGIVARRRGIPAIWFVPNGVSDGRFLDLNKRLYRSLFRYGNVIPVANSRFTDSTFGSGDFRRHIVHLGVDTDFCRPFLDDGGVRARFGIPRAATVIGLFARMTPSKGQLGLVESVACLQDHIHILFCGGPLGGDYHKVLIKAIASLGLEDRVHFAGFQTDLRPYYASCDILSNLLAYPEGFGLTVVEAMASGKPVLAHAAGGPSETIIDGRTGWLIPSCETDDIVHGLHRVVADRSHWAEMGRLGRVRAEEEFSLYRFDARVKEVVEEEVRRFEVCA